MPSMVHIVPPWNITEPPSFDAEISSPRPTCIAPPVIVMVDPEPSACNPSFDRFKSLGFTSTAQ